MELVRPSGLWGQPVLAAPAPRLLPPGTRLRMSSVERSAPRPSGNESSIRAHIIAAQIAALAEVFQAPAFTVTVRGHGRLIVTTDLLAGFTELVNAAYRLLSAPPTGAAEEDPQTPITVGLGNPESGLAGAGARLTAQGLMMTWSGLIPAVEVEDLERAADITKRWIYLSDHDTSVVPVERPRQEIWIGGRRFRPDLVRQALADCGAQGITVDLTHDGLGVSAALPMGIDPRSLRAAVQRRIPAHTLIDRWDLQTTVASERPALLDALLAGCRETLGCNAQPDDDFFALGGDSLSATRLLHYLREHAGVVLDLPAFLRALHTRNLVRTAIALDSTRDADPTPVAPQSPPVPDVFPLTQQQQAYVMGRGDHFASGGVSCHTYLEFDGDLDDDCPARFERCWRRLHERHSMLRVSIDPAELKQRINHVESLPSFEFIDLSAMTPEAVDARLLELREEISHRVGPLEGPLHLVRMIRLPKGHVRVCFSFDALATDLASMGTLFRELDQLWQDPECELPTNGIEFSQYVLAESSNDPDDRARALAYWDEKLSGLPPAPEFPAPSRGAPGRFRPHPTRIDAKLWQGALENAAAWGITASALLAACHGEVLSQWATSQRFTVNLPRFNRREIHPDVEQVVGEFASITLIIIDRTRPESFGRFARDLQEQIWADLDHDHLSGIEIMRRLRQLQGGAGGAALMPVVLTAGVALPGDHTRLLGGRLERSFRLSQTPQVDMDCIVEERDGGLVVNWDHREGAIDTSIVAAMAEEFARLVGRLADPNAWSELDPARTAERVNLSELPGSTLEVEDRWVHEAIWRQADADPGAPALVGANSTTTRGELTRWAQHLVSLLSNLPD